MKSLLCSFGLLLLPTLTAYAADEKPAKSNTLTSKEVADGWILLFDGETTFGWKIEGNAKIENGLLMLGGDKAAKITTTTEFAACWLSLEYSIKGNEGAKIVQGEKDIVLPTPEQDKWIKGKINLDSRGEGGGDFRVIGNESKIYLSKTAEGDRPNKHRSAIQLDVPTGTTLTLRNFKLKPVQDIAPADGELKAIFNGKDLTGWKEIHTDRTKSTFGVNDKGELIIKNGPGDIQTEGQWDDFVLQIDVLSNGPHLNSGVFFRCLPGISWSGYEAQIRNEWISDVTLKDGTKLSGSLTLKGDEAALQVYTVQGKQARPALPRQVKKFARADITELIDHRDMPIDFGTGAIYNQQAARKVVSNDHEWYTMTIVANGNHLAVWVNGYQTADFTDKRPPNESARKGAKVDKGPVSLQGHDPTTDLCFKNIRIAELPK